MGKVIVSESRQITVPSWAVATIKFLGPVIVAIAIGYSRFVGVEKEVALNKDLISEYRVKVETHRDLISNLQSQLSKVDLKQSVLEKGIAEALVRIETSIKDVQLDVKELQKQKRP